MRGVITGLDVVMNCRLIWREFGLLCLVRCLLACLEGRRKTTFLDVAFRK